MKCLFALAVFLSSVVMADVSSTREVLRKYSENNPAVLEVYDEAVASWIEYGKCAGERWDINKLLVAVEFAAKKHKGQVRKDAAKTPYIIHPIGVANLLWQTGNIRSVNVLTAALLHDTLEDTDATEVEVEELFGPRVLYTVKEVTNDPNLSGMENKKLQVEHAPTMSLDGQLVKLADRVYNVGDLKNPPPSWSKEKIDEYYGWGEKLLNALPGTNAGLELSLEEKINAHRGITKTTKCK